jgi:Tol biopolymer transport system component
MKTPALRNSIALFSCLASMLFGIASSQISNAAASPTLVVTNDGRGELIDIASDASRAFRLTNADEPGFVYAREVSTSKNGTLVFRGNTDVGTSIFTATSMGTGIKQITHPNPALTDPTCAGNDIAPQISQDGSKVVFLSTRGAAAQATPQCGVFSIYVVNIDGSGLKQINSLQSKDNGDGLSIRSVTWSPDGSRLAFRGDRLIVKNDGTKNITQAADVLGIINVDGSGEMDLPIFDCAQGQLLDWQADKVMYSVGGGIQGCPNDGRTDLAIYDVKTHATTQVIANQLNNDVNSSPGSARLSTSADQYIYTCFDRTNGNQDPAICINRLDGTNLQIKKQGSILNHDWISWASGKSMPLPSKIVPNLSTVSYKRGSGKLHLGATVQDAKGNKVVAIDISWTGEIISSSGDINLPKSSKVVGRKVVTGHWGNISTPITVTVT